jgi:hypothetical protein
METHTSRHLGTVCRCFSFVIQGIHYYSITHPFVTLPTTFSGDKFEFHGGCDLVLLKSPYFGRGIGMDIHVRAKIDTWWSFIETAVIRIGDDILEVTGGSDGGQHWINGEAGGLKDGDSFYLSGFSAVFVQVDPVHKTYRIELGNGGAIKIAAYKRFVSVDIHATTQDQFQGTLGLMGSYPEGKRVGRDGKTVFMDDAIAFGKEWQVLASESMLFRNLEGPQHPQECDMPTETKVKRRLGESRISKQDAELACDRVNSEDFDACVFDVLATNDKGMAGAY